MKKVLLMALLALCYSVTAVAQEPVRIGMITTLSTKAGYLGEDIRDGFQLAVDEGKGTLGGIAVDLLVDDDNRKPEKARQIAERFIKRDKAQILTGIVFSNVATAVVPKVVREDVFYISPNAGPSMLAGKGCDPNYFNVAWQNDNLHEAAGKYVNDKGFNKVYLLAPNYPGGKDAVSGFKRFYKGGIAGEVYTNLGQSDYAAELASLRAAAPDAVFFFLPGGMGINFIKQYAQAGLNKTIPLFGPAFSFDERLLQAVGDAGLGVINGSQWSPDLDTPKNRAFVEAFRATYGRTPTLYASQGYDAAQLIGSALKKVGGDMNRQDDFRAALKAADFTSVRGNFRFGKNNHPIQDIYVREVVKTADGKYTNRIVEKTFVDHVDAYASECSMK
ncbi:MAG: ABC transporter substrate-binding protein [Desulfobulbaceae bacterium]|uniref:ABC transporter substrate-binding protein n=1 Tax=Candidatus Desulfatifera sulfidica TaxID=2841691 RepID=A0A8J6N915_9BACT|nr:ABC transporter substrate-binding protein [Candidatus Desulfatifera sulfidica]